MKKTVSKYYGNSERGRMSDIWNALWVLDGLRSIKNSFFLSERSYRMRVNSNKHSFWQ